MRPREWHSTPQKEKNGRNLFAIVWQKRPKKKEPNKKKQRPKTRYPPVKPGSNVLHLDKAGYIQENYVEPSGTQSNPEKPSQTL